MSKFSTKHPMPVDTREKVLEILHKRLYDTIDLQNQIKIAHWNVKGPSFIGLHKLFDEIYTNVIGYVDEIAERITTLGDLTTQTVHEVSKKTSLKPYPTDIINGKDHVEAISNALSIYSKNIREDVKKLGDLDPRTEDMFIDISQTVEQYLWFVESHAQADS